MLLFIILCVRYFLQQTKYMIYTKLLLDRQKNFIISW